MTEKLLNRRDIEFLLYGMLDTESLLQRERYREHSREVFDATLDTAEKIARNYIANQYRKGDADETRADGERIRPIPETREDWNALAEAGFLAMHQDVEEGGMQLPAVVCSVANAYFSAANIAIAGYPFLTTGASNLILSIGIDEQKTKFVPPMMKMNESHIGMGIGAAVLACQGYLHALEFARQRLQGRLPSNRDPSSKQAMMIEHTDVRRMLLARKACAEGALALCLYTSSLVENRDTAETDCEKQRAAVLLDLLTPVVKSWPSRYGCVSNDLAIEALDLLGRKIPMQNRYGYKIFKQEVRITLQLANDIEELQDLIVRIQQSLNRLDDVTDALLAAIEKDADSGLANADLYLDCFGRVVMAWIWLKQAVTAQKALLRHQPDLSESEAGFYRGKLQAARYYIEWELPYTTPLAELLIPNNRTCFEMRNEWF